MQTKKRAKPVKFNSKEDKKKAVKDAAKEIEEKVSLREKNIKHSAFDDAPSASEHDIGAEAHSSSTVEEIKITEIIGSLESEVVEPSEVGSEGKDGVEAKKAQKPLKKTDKKVDIELSKLDLQKTSQEILSDETPTEEISKDYPLEKDQAFFNEPPDGLDSKKSSLHYFFKVMLITFFAGLVFFAGIYYAVSNKSIKFGQFDKKIDATIAVSTPSPTSKPVDLAEYPLQVLNGTNTPGIAAKVKADLESVGFKVQLIGNAENTDFVNTVILAKKKVNKQVIDKLKVVLSKTYALGSVSELASGEADIVIKIGSQSAK